ncbi:MAG: YciI family protein [Rudaea sp.]
MRFMIIVKATADSEAGVMPSDSLFAQMGKFHAQLDAAGILLDASGLQATSKGWRVKYSGANRSIVNGPFAETRELIAGYTIIKADSREQAQEWTQRFPNPTLDGSDCEIEVRQMFELDDFEPSAELERFRELQTTSNQSAR